jgi:multicomponent Na+:H+ antiporter subunit G
MVTDIICGAFMIIGTAFMFLGCVGILRMPDLLTRMQTATKPPTLGVFFLMLSVAFYFPDIGVTVRVLAITLFVFLTTPVSAHMIGRAGYQVGVKFWKGTVMDELKGKYRGSSIDS